MLTASRTFSRLLWLSLVALLLTSGVASAADAPPNFIVILADDLGYGDLSCYGATKQKTPNLDRMAAEGARFTSFYVTTPFCSPTRAGLLTGCYPRRLGIDRVFFPGDELGLNPDETTIAEVLKERGYATCAIGKWHLGDQPVFMPLRQGFDEYFGIPYSNDMWPFFNGRRREVRGRSVWNHPPLPLVRNDTVLGPVSDQTNLVEAYTQEAERFIRDHKEGPFFLYMPHSAMHLPLYPGKPFQGTSQNGHYGDWVQELDASVGRVLAAVRDAGIDEQTLVIFTSDNGATANAAGSNAPLRGGKGGTYEGGQREPFIARWPSKIRAGSECDELAASIDLLPTLARLAGGQAPTDRVIDGKDIWPLLSAAEGAKTPHEAFYYYRGRSLEAVRSGDWKLRLVDGALYNLREDIAESTDVAAANADVVKHLTAVAEEARRTLGDADRDGSECRAVGQVAAPRALIAHDGTIAEDARPDGAAGHDAAHVTSARRPNIIYLMTDDQGYGDVGFHGNRQIKTPNLDRFAAEGVELTRFYANPVCAPTRAGLMTGRYYYRTGIIHTSRGAAKMHGEETTIPEFLKLVGYQTGIFGKWHLGDNYPMRPEDQGFDESLVHRSGGITQTPDLDGHYFDPPLYRDGKRVQGRGYCTDIFFDAAMQFIEANREAPFFVYLPTNAPHAPLEIADEYVKPYLAMGLDDTTARVYGMIENIDENFGRLVAKLDELGLRDDTILVFTTDNGHQQDRFSAGLRGKKAQVYEGGVRVPFVIQWPKRLAGGRKIDIAAAHIDILPTLLDAANAPIEADPRLDGVTLLPILEGKSTAALDRTIFVQGHRGLTPQPYQNAAAITQRFKLLAYGDKFQVEGLKIPAEPAFELYDLEADPAESRNVAVEYPEVLAKLRKEYDDWFASVEGERSFEPGTIHIGSDFENPLLLCRYQDADFVGAQPQGWRVSVDRGGRYRLTIRAPRAPVAGGTLGVAWSGATVSRRLDGNTLSAVVNLAPGKGVLDVTLDEGAANTLRTDFDVIIERLAPATR